MMHASVEVPAYATLSPTMPTCAASVVSPLISELMFHSVVSAMAIAQRQSDNASEIFAFAVTAFIFF